MKILIELGGCLVITFSLIFATICAFLLEKIIEIWFDKEKKPQTQNPKSKTTIYLLLIVFFGVVSAILQNEGNNIYGFSKSYVENKQLMSIASGKEPPIGE